MSARFVPVSWTPAKVVYDLALLAGVVGFLFAFQRAAPLLVTDWQGSDGASLAMQAFGSCAFVLLSLALAIGPLARLDPRFAPLLYNRRHLGVITCIVALSHAIAVLDWYFAFSPTPPLVALLTSEPPPGAASGLPFVPLGLAALLVLSVLAATSHDFWLTFLGPSAWKALHMAIYPAYALVVAHVAFGALQDDGRGALALLVTGAAAIVLGLHLAAAWRQRRRDDAAPLAAQVPWVSAGRADAVAEGRAIIVRPADGEAVAIFRHGGRLSAVSNLCAHQNGPLGEGRIVDGCITCPWHGFQYRPEDGCAPPPYSERLATYNLRLDGPLLLLDPRPNPPGTRVEPLPIPTSPGPDAGAPFFIGWARGIPPGLRRHVLGAILAVVAGMPLLGLALGLATQDAAGRAFALVPGQVLLPDLPQGATLRGIMIAGPYPLLHLPGDGPDDRGRTLLLARDGKLGAAPEWRAWHGRLVTAEGFILRRGSIEMLVPAEPPTPVDAAAPPAPPRAEPLGRWRLQGEICDGKCAAGGMRPGTGIAHRACATLCLDGEIPAVFVTTGPVEGRAFLLLADAAGGPAMPAFRDLIGRRVTLDGQVERLGDMLVFRAERP